MQTIIDFFLLKARRKPDVRTGVAAIHRDKTL